VGTVINAPAWCRWTASSRRERRRRATPRLVLQRDTPITEGGDQQYDHSGAGSGFSLTCIAEYVPADVGGDRHDCDGPHLFDLVNGGRVSRQRATTWSCVHRPRPEGWAPRGVIPFSSMA